MTALRDSPCGTELAPEPTGSRRQTTDPLDAPREGATAASATAARDADRLVELFGGRFVDVDGGRLHPEGARLLLRGGRIAELLPPGASGPDGRGSNAERVDLGGLVVMPGLANTHAHLQIVIPSLVPQRAHARRTRQHAWEQRALALRECTLRGVTVVREALTPDVRRTAAVRRRTERARPRGPRVAQAVLVAPIGGVFTPRQSPWQRALDRATGMATVPYDAPYCGAVVLPSGAGVSAVRDAVDRAIDERGADAIKLYHQRERLLTFRPTARVMTQEQLDAAADRCRSRAVACTLHALTVEGFRRGVRAGVGSIAHMPSDEPLTDHDVQAAAAAGVVVEPTLTLCYALGWRPVSGSERERARLRELRRVRQSTARALADAHWTPALAPVFLDGLARSASGDTTLLGGLYDVERVFRYYGGVVGHGVDNTSRLLQGGVRLACGNDAGAVPATAAMIGLELLLWQRLLGGAATSGVTLVRAVTSNAAAALAMPGLTGRLAAGCHADLVAYDRNPLDDPIALGQRAAAVWRDGRLVVGQVTAGRLQPATRSAGR